MQCNCGSEHFDARFLCGYCVYKMTNESLRPAKVNNRTVLFITLTFVILFVSYVVYMIPGKVTAAFGDDQSVYLVSAKALAAGQGYRLISRPDTPFDTAYPIGYPALIAPVFLLSASDYNAFFSARIVTLLLCFICSLLAWRFLQDYTSKNVAALLAVIIGFNPQVFLSSSNIASEWPFALTVLIVIVLSKKSLVIACPSAFIGTAFAAGICAAGATLIRTLGFTVVMGLIAYFCINRYWRHLINFLCGVGIIYAPWFLWSHAQSGKTAGGSRYLNQFADEFSWSTPLRNAWDISTHLFSQLFFPPFDSRIVISTLGRYHLTGFISLVGLAFTLVFLIGLFQLIRRRDVVPAVLIPYLVIVIFWPWDFMRFLMPLFVLFLAAFVVGGQTLLSRLESRKDKTAGTLVRKSIIPLLIFTVFSAAVIDGMWTRNLYKYKNAAGQEAAEEWNERTLALDWLQQNTPGNSLVMSSYPEAVYLFTRRKTLSQGRSAAEIDAVLSQYRSKAKVFLFATERKSAAQFDKDKEFGMAPVLEYVRQKPGALTLKWKNKANTMMIFEVTS